LRSASSGSNEHGGLLALQCAAVTVQRDELAILTEARSRILQLSGQKQQQFRVRQPRLSYE